LVDRVWLAARRDSDDCRAGEALQFSTREGHDLRNKLEGRSNRDGQSEFESPVAGEPAPGRAEVRTATRVVRGGRSNKQEQVQNCFHNQTPAPAPCPCS